KAGADILDFFLQTRFVRRLHSLSPLVVFAKATRAWSSGTPRRWFNFSCSRFRVVQVASRHHVGASWGSGASSHLADVPLHYFINGAGGMELTNCKGKDLAQNLPSSQFDEVHITGHNGAMKIMGNADQITFTFLTTDGTPGDTCTLTKSGQSQKLQCGKKGSGSSLACPPLPQISKDQAHSRLTSAITAPQTPRLWPPATAYAPAGTHNARPPNVAAHLLLPKRDFSRSVRTASG